MTVMTVGVVLTGLGASVLAVDLPVYFNVRNQLQTAVDAAALAGAYELPEGQQQAEEAAYRFASENEVAGRSLEPDELSYASDNSKFTVTGSVQVPTIIGKFVCSLAGKNDGSLDGDDSQVPNSSSSSSCSAMTVVAGSSAAPAARDTILVVDTSNSMDDLGNNRPMRDVKSAAVNYVNMIANFDNGSVDRIGLVTFDQASKLQKGLKSETEDPGYNSLKNTINGLKLFSGSGWNTNYETGLKTALNEMQSKGRPNAQKIIIFMTDGMPNLPAPANYYTYSSSQPYTKCTDIVDNSTAVKNLCTKKNGTTVCPVLPSTQIKDSMISASAVSCGQTYVNFMQSVTNAQADRAKTMGVTIHTVNINDSGNTQNSEAILRRLLKSPSWEPNQIQYMADVTNGEKYEAANYDAAGINRIYEAIAKDIHIKLVR